MRSGFEPITRTLVACVFISDGVCRDGDASDQDKGRNKSRNINPTGQGQVGPWVGGHLGVRQGWEGGLGTDWGHVLPLRE